MGLLLTEDPVPGARETGTRIYLVDDHPLVCEGLTRILTGQPDLEVVGFAHGGSPALAELRQSPADLVLVDHDLQSDPTGPQLCRQLTGEGYRLTVLGLCARADAGDVRQLLAAGASGVLLKDSDAARIVEAVRVVVAGGTYLDPKLTPLVMQELSPQPEPTDRLSPIEMRVLCQMAEGRSNKEIARDLGVSLGSVKSHVSHLLHALGVSRRTEAVALAARRGLLAPSVPRSNP